MSRKCSLSIVIAVFIALVVFGDRIIAKMIDRLVMSTRFRYAELYRGELAADTVILGNSRGLHMFHRPAIRDVTGGEVTNISFNALPTVLMPALWSDYLDRHPKPEKIIFEVSCIGRKDEVASISRFTTFMSHSEGLAHAIQIHDPRVFTATRVSSLYAFNNELTLRSLMFMRKSDRDWIMTETANEAKIERTIQLGTEELLRSSLNVEAAKKVIEISTQGNIPVTLVLAPYHPEYRKAYAELPQWLEWLSGELGQPIHDYSECELDLRGFSDHMHLNEKGAAEYAEILSRDGLL